MDKTIIALFCYKRAAKLKAAVEALLRNPESREMDIIFFSDGFRNLADKPGVMEVRDYINSIKGFRNVYKQFRDTNLSSAPNFQEGIDYLTRHYDSFIVVEDDLIVTPNYLRYMLDGLAYYRDQQAVFCITGYCFPISKRNYPYDSIICNRFCSYGWASWSDKMRKVHWDHNEMARLIRTSPDFRKRLDSEGLDLFRTLVKQLIGSISAWDILMQVHISENHLKVVYPTVSKVSNIGFDSESTNTFGINYLKTVTDTGEKRNFDFCMPDVIEPSLQQQIRKPYMFTALATRKVANTFIKLSYSWL